GRASIAEGRLVALRRACIDAGETFGVDVRSAFHMADVEILQNGTPPRHEQMAARVLVSRERGRMLTYEILEEGHVPGLTEGEGSLFMRVAALFAADRNRDRGFTVTFDSLIGLKNEYLNGERVRFAVRATRPCYIHVFCLTHHGDVYQVFPNVHDTDNVVRPGDSRIIPSSDATPIGVWLEGADEYALDQISVVATKDPVPYTEGAWIRPEKPGSMPIRKGRLQEYFSWLWGLDTDWAEAWHVYGIRK
ncbi:MAG: DUF4384 domain-containing protein, partial [Bacteroidota bacterium]